jgi:hypothetical protein
LFLQQYMFCRNTDYATGLGYNITYTGLYNDAQNTMPNSFINVADTY